VSKSLFLDYSVLIKNLTRYLQVT